MGWLDETPFNGALFFAGVRLARASHGVASDAFRLGDQC